MDETTYELIIQIAPIVISALSVIIGFSIAFIADPAKESILGFFKRRKIRLALYKEMMNNYDTLDVYGNSSEEDDDMKVFSALIFVEKEYYDYVKKNEITEFYLLKEASTITSIYRLIGELVDEEPKFESYLLSITKEKGENTIFSSKLKLRKYLTYEFPIQFGEFIKNNQLDKKFMEKNFGKDKVKKILENMEKLKSRQQKQ